MVSALLLCLLSSRWKRFFERKKLISCIYLPEDFCKKMAAARKRRAIAEIEDLMRMSDDSDSDDVNPSSGTSSGLEEEKEDSDAEPFPPLDNPEVHEGF